ncbi:hypothetical protein C0J52_06666 [Blattella germanica]|nr:hypothetical protein C0J52_06666 [Blattella germanica]
MKLLLVLIWLIGVFVVLIPASTRKESHHLCLCVLRLLIFSSVICAESRDQPALALKCLESQLRRITCI